MLVHQQHAVVRSFAYLGWTLGITAAVAGAIAALATPGLTVGWALGSFFVSLVLLLAVLAGRDTFELATLRTLMTGFAVSQGVFFGHAVARFSVPAVAAAVGVGGLVFLAMALWGLVTQRELATLGTFLFWGLLALLGCLVVATAFGAGPVVVALVIAGAVLFALYTAYDVHWIVQESASAADAEAAERIAIEGALSLYLDLANLVLDILRALDWFEIFGW